LAGAVLVLADHESLLGVSLVPTHVLTVRIGLQG
jgi:hypothetical protein